MPPPSDDERDLLSDALNLAFDVARNGTSDLSTFLADIRSEAGKIAETASAQLRRVRAEGRDDFAERSGRLANDAASVALEIAVAAKQAIDEHPLERDKNLDHLAKLVGFFGSIFIDTANKAVGNAAGQAATNRARQITVEVAPGEPARTSAWVVNRGSSTVADATVRIVGGRPGGLVISAVPKQLTIDPRGRKRVTLRAALTSSSTHVAGDFVDALLVVDGVGSIVIRAVVKDPSRPAEPAAPPPDTPTTAS